MEGQHIRVKAVLRHGGGVAAPAQVQAREVQIGGVAVLQRGGGVGDSSAPVGDAVSQDGCLNTLFPLGHGEFRSLRPGADDAVVGIQRPHTPIVFSGVGAGIFVITGAGGVHNAAPDSSLIWHGAVFFLRWGGHQLHLIVCDIVKRNPLVHRIDGLMKVRHLVKGVEQRCLWHWQ